MMKNSKLKSLINNYNVIRILSDMLVRMLVVFAFVGMMVLFASGCGKRTANIQVFQYEVADDGEIHITGLTDKGKTDSKLIVPSEIDGARVVYIDSGAFRDDYNVTSIVIEDGVKEIASSAFLNCVNLSDITFPASVKKIGTNAVVNTKWENEHISGATEIIVNDILVEVSKDLARYEIPKSVRYISSGAFYGQEILENVIIPEGVEIIDTYAFADCVKLGNVKLPDSIRSIEYCAFSNCTDADITVPVTVVNIGQDAFLGVKHVGYLGSLEGVEGRWGAVTFN